MPIYEPPAAVGDFARSDKFHVLRDDWHRRMVKDLDAIRNGPRRSPFFYDQINDESGVPDGSPIPISWNAFPLRLVKWFGKRDAHRAAEIVMTLPVFGLYAADGRPIALPFRVQDEYCEWHVHRTGSRIDRIDFTCEPPEYWNFLASRDFQLVHSLYEELLYQKIPDDDLKWSEDVFDSGGAIVHNKGDYNPWIVWITERGAIHLTHPANSLYAEMVLASDSTKIWPVQPDAAGHIDEIEIMGCAGVGGINRSSDPLILKGAFGQARQGRSVALANPIGLYMAPFSLSGLLDPEDEAIGEKALTFVRQSPDGQKILRAEVAPPASASYGLEACSLGGDAVTHGGQIAKLITMRLFATAKKIPGVEPLEVKTCPSFVCAHPQRPSFLGTFSRKDKASCDDVEPQDWSEEAYDIPEIEAPTLVAAVDQPDATPDLPARGTRSLALNRTASA